MPSSPSGRCVCYLTAKIEQPELMPSSPSGRCVRYLTAKTKQPELMPPAVLLKKVKLKKTFKELVRWQRELPSDRK